MISSLHYAARADIFGREGLSQTKRVSKFFVFLNAMIFAFTTFVTNTPLYGKIASKVWKIYFQYISPHFLDAAGSQISDLWLLLLSNSSLFSALMSHLPLLLLHSVLKDMPFRRPFQIKVKLFKRALGWSCPSILYYTKGQFERAFRGQQFFNNLNNKLFLVSRRLRLFWTKPTPAVRAIVIVINTFVINNIRVQWDYFFNQTFLSGNTFSMGMLGQLKRAI